MYKDPLNELIETLNRAKRSSDKLSKIEDAIQRHYFDGDAVHFEKEAMRILDGDLVSKIKSILRGLGVL
jgi:hypothetical protein